MDMFNQLTDDLLIKILSFLPTKDAVAMSVLSKRWLSLWTLVPSLYFEELSVDDVVRVLPSHVVLGTLMFHKSPVLESFHIKKSFTCDDSEVYLWVRIVIDRFVRDLRICFNEVHCRIRLPSSLFRCQTLETLQLEKVISLEVPTRFSLPSFRTLSLICVKYADEESFIRLISCSHVLENLVVGCCNDDNVATFTINVPSLRSLVVLTGVHDSNTTHHRFVIHSHSLNQLEIVDWRGEVNVIGKMPNLVEASLDIFETQGNTLECLTHVKRVSLSLAGVFKYPIGSIFSQLVRLDFYGYDENWWNLLMHVLHHTPMLQFLKLDWVNHQPNIWKPEEEDKFCWIKPRCAGECLFGLKTFEWKKYAGTEQEKQVAVYILKNARRLVTATIDIESEVTYLDPVESARRLKVFEELEISTGGSRACELTLTE